MAVGVHALLHEGRVTEDEVQDGGSAVLRIGGTLCAKRVRHSVLGLRGAELKCIGAEDELRPVAVGEERIADAACGGEDVGVSVRDRRGDPIGELGEQLLLVREVPIERAGLHIESGGDTPHGQICEPHLVEQRERAPGHAVAVVTREIVLWAHGPIIVNDVQVNTVQVVRVERLTVTSSPGVSSPPIALERVSVELDGRTVLRDVSVELTAPKIAVIGANGSGKSTFARVLNGLVAPRSGTASVHGFDTVRERAAVRRLVGFVFTNPDAQILMPTPAEDLALSLRGLPKAEVAERVRQTLGTHGLGEHAEVPASSLSGGQKQMLALASVLIAEPRVIVADEPTTLLDLRNARRIGDLLLAQRAQVVVVTHDLELAARCDTALLFDEGRLVSAGHPSSVIETYRLACA